MAAIVTGKVRFSYVNVFTPKASLDGGDPKYSVTIILPKTDPTTFQAIQGAIAQAAQEGLPGKFKGQMPARLVDPIHDGDGLKDNGDPYGDECKGHWVFSASSLSQPGVVDATIQPIINQKDFYSGCYGRADINFFAYNTAGKKGVGCGLNNIQKLEDGESLGGGRTAAEAFGGGNAQQQPTTYQAPYQQPTTYQAPYQPTPYQTPQQTPQLYQTPQQYPQVAPAIDPLTGLPITSIMGL